MYGVIILKILLIGGSDSAVLQYFWVNIDTNPESSEWFIEDQVFLPSYYLAPGLISSHPPLSCQQFVSLSQSFCV